MERVSGHPDQLEDDEYFKRYRGCTGKTPFPSKRKAEGRAEMLRRRGQPFTSYHCPTCGRWHLSRRKT